MEHKIIHIYIYIYDHLILLTNYYKTDINKGLLSKINFKFYIINWDF
jgi:hypothetical protein